MATMGRLVELVGVYRADGGPLGELRYVAGKVMGSTHCGLCDITHGTVRRRPEWDEMVARLGVPVVLMHLNEMPREVGAAVRGSGAPVVLGRDTEGALETLLVAEELDTLEGSVERFERALLERLEERGWVEAGAVAR